MKGQRGDQQQYVESAEQLFATAKRSFQFELCGTEGTAVSVEIPLIQDATGRTAIDYCLGEDYTRREWQKHALEESEVSKTINLAMAQVIFEGMSEYSFMHGGDAIVEAVINAVKINLPGIGNYLDGRLKKGPYFRENALQPIK